MCDPDRDDRQFMYLTDILLGYSGNSKDMRGQIAWRSFRANNHKKNRKLVTLQEAIRFRDEFLNEWETQLLEEGATLCRSPKFFVKSKSSTAGALVWKTPKNSTVFYVEATPHDVVKHLAENHKENNTKHNSEADPALQCKRVARRQTSSSKKRAWQFEGPRRLHSIIPQARQEVQRIRNHLTVPMHDHAAWEVDSILDHMSSGPFHLSRDLSFDVLKVAEEYSINMIEELLASLRKYVSAQFLGTDGAHHRHGHNPHRGHNAPGGHDESNHHNANFSSPTSEGNVAAPFASIKIPCASYNSKQTEGEEYLTSTVFRLTEKRPKLGLLSFDRDNSAIRSANELFGEEESSKYAFDMADETVPPEEDSRGDHKNEGSKLPATVLIANSGPGRQEEQAVGQVQTSRDMGGNEYLQSLNHLSIKSPLRRAWKQGHDSESKRSCFSPARDVGVTEAQVDRVINQTQCLAQRKEFDCLGHHTLMLDTERKLLQWLIRVVEREMKEDSKIGVMECSWIGRVAMFYHAYVEYLHSYLGATNPEQSKPYEVYISHTGSEKESYARPLHAFLEGQNVSAFLDEDYSRTGDYPSETRMRELLTCRNCWCILSHNFVNDEWSMRELMISYVRFMREKRGHYGLIMDCFEDGITRRPVGYWTELILKSKALRPHDQYGSPQVFPWKMRRARDNETYEQRMAHIAGEKLANGHILVPRTDGSESSLIERDLLCKETSIFPIRSLCDKIWSASAIRILTTWISNLHLIEEALVEALKAGAKLQILLLSPISSQADARNCALDDLEVPPRYLQNGISWNMEQLEAICIRAGIFPGSQAAKRVQIRLYDSTPTISVYQTDEHVYVGCFYHGRLAGSSPYIGASSDSCYGRSAIEEIDFLWQRATAVSCFYWPENACNLTRV